MTVTRDEMVRGLRKLGLEAGDLVLVCSSLSSLDGIEGGGDTVIDAFLEVVGPEGTVAMHTGRHITGWPRPLFNPQTSPSEMGPISNAFWRRPGARRSREPVRSVAAIGPSADELTRMHDGDERRDSPWGDRPFGQESPWQRLYDRDAKYVLLGEDWSKARLFGLAQVLYTEAMRGQYKPEVAFPCFDQRLMGQKLEEEGLVKEVQVSQVAVKMISVRALVDRSLALFREDPLSYFPEGFEDRFGFVAWYRRIPFMERRLQAGMGKVCITPEVLYRHRGVYWDLWARALVVRDEHMTVGLVLADHGGIKRYQVQEVRRRVEQRCDLPAGHLMVACTHTHRVPMILGSEAIPEYAEAVVEGLADAVCQAVAGMRPVRVGVGKVRTEGIAVNRRIKMIDGRVFTSRYSVPSTWYMPPEIIQGYGPVDPWLTTLRIEDLEGRVVGVVGNFTGHPLAAFRSKYISGDSFGHAEDVMELVHSGSVAMLTNGAEGNVIARGPIPERGPRYDPQGEQLGQMIGGYWLTALARAEALDGGSVAAVQREVELPLRASFMEWVRNGSAEIQRAYAELADRGMALTEVQVLRINDTVLVSMPGEAFVEVQLMIKEKSKFPNTVVLGLTNDHLGYIPTREAFSEGGYEVQEVPEQWQFSTEDALGALGITALELIDELWNEYSAEGEAASLSA